MGERKLGDLELIAGLVREMSPEWRWDDGLGWLEWSGRHWQRQPREVVRTAGRAAAQRIGVTTMLRVHAVVDAIAGEAEMRVAPGALDANPRLLNVRNGTVDLTTGELRPHNPADLITLITDVDHDPDSEHRAVTAAWDALDIGPRMWLIEALGAAALGHGPRLQIMPVLDGMGENGKTVLMEGVMSALGAWCTTSPAKLLVGDATDYELAQLRARRLVVVDETPQHGRLNMATVKRITGGGTLNGRHPYGRPFEFPSTHMVICATNWLPSVNEQTHAAWRRLRRVTFTKTFDRNNPDRIEGLLDIVQHDPAARTAMLNVIVTGARLYHNRGLTQCDAIDHATDEWRTNDDHVGQFVDDCLSLSPQTLGTATTPIRDVYRRYRSWCDEMGRSLPLQQRTLVDQLLAHPGLAGHAIRRDKSNGVRVLRGLALQDHQHGAWQ